MKQYVVQDIINKKQQNGRTYYRVKWKGYASSSNTWQPQQHLNQTLIQYYNQKQQAQELKRSKLTSMQATAQPDKPDKPIKRELEILDIDSDSDEIIFKVITQGGRTKKIKHINLINQHPKKLAQFYISKYVKVNQNNSQN